MKCCEYSGFVALNSTQSVDNYASIIQNISASVAAEDVPPLDKKLNNVPVVHYRSIAGYVARRINNILKDSDCPCHDVLKPQPEQEQYLFDLDCGGLTFSSKTVCDFLSECFAIIEHVHPLLLEIKNCLRDSTRQIILNIISLSSPFTGCQKHCNRATDILVNVVINVFYNNFQKQIKRQCPKK